MRLFVIGVSHKTAPIEVREQLAFPKHAQDKALELFREQEDVHEVVILSTCNRTEIYAVTSASCDGPGLVLDVLDSFHRLDSEYFKRYLYVMMGERAVRHLFRVVSSLDSMVVGEAQILGQLKEAYRAASEARTTGRVLNRLFRQSFEVGKRVRMETGISRSAVSVGYAAVEKGRQILCSLECRTVLLVGAGAMAELTAKHLAGQGAAQVLVVNRTFERARELASAFSGLALPFEQLYEAIAASDIVISSSSSPECLITRDGLARVMSQRTAPLFLIDIAVPRDIDPAVAEIPGVHLCDIDDLSGVVRCNMEGRRAETGRAEAIIDEEMRAFFEWVGWMQVVPTVKAIRGRAEEIREQEVAQTVRRLGLSAEETAAVERLTRRIVNKLLHEPTTRLREASSWQEAYAYTEVARDLFGVDCLDETRCRAIRTVIASGTTGEYTEQAEAEERGCCGA